MIAWLYWDPDRVMFYIPYLNYPIMWYGFFFALGVISGYVLLRGLLKVFFAKEPFFVMTEVQSWERFLMTLKNKKEHPFIHNFLQTLPNPLRDKIVSWNLNKGIDESFQKSLLFGMNHFIETARGYPNKLSVRLLFDEIFSCSLLPLKNKTTLLAEQLLVYTTVGGVIGARLGHLIFYENFTEYLLHPLNIFKVWEGGLASHGGVAGIIIAFFIFRFKHLKSYPEISIMRLIDFTILPAALSGSIIRIGNFFNQEILGKATTVPWAVIFAHPMDGSIAVARHPAQLYEAIFYFVLAVALIGLSCHKRWLSQAGKLGGFTLFCMFTFRFAIEFLKEEQSYYHLGFLNVAQLLTLPVVCIAVSMWVSSFLFKNKALVSNQAR